MLAYLIIIRPFSGHPGDIAYANQGCHRDSENTFNTRERMGVRLKGRPVKLASDIAMELAMLYSTYF